MTPGAIVVTLTMVTFVGGIAAMAYRIWRQRHPILDAETVRVRAVAQRVWTEDYGMSGEPPAIDLVRPPSLGCGRNGNGFMVNGECVAGATYLDLWFTELAWPSDGVAISDGALAHELNHARLYRLGDASGGDHFSGSFQEYVAAENKKLKALGL